MRTPIMVILPLFIDFGNMKFYIYLIFIDIILILFLGNFNHLVFFYKKKK